MTHECKEDRGCICGVLAEEPDENCPNHGHPWPPRCACGRFVKQEDTAYIQSLGNNNDTCPSE